MANIPEDALRSDDGHYWWDGKQWQLIEQDDSAAGGSADNERVAARIAAGYPAAVEHLTDDQKKALLAEPIVTIEAHSHDEVEVPVMEGHENGGATS